VVSIDMRITRDTAVCGGRWDAPLVTEMAAAAGDG
jgi:hypothetical protein